MHDYPHASCRRRRLRLLGWLAGKLGIGVNLWAWWHVGAMTQWSADAARTESPEQLGVAGKLAVLLGGVKIPRPENQTKPATIGQPLETHRFDNGQ